MRHHFDHARFPTWKAKQRYIHYFLSLPIGLESSKLLEEFMGHRVGEMVKENGWDDFLERLRRRATPLICEFYSNVE